MTRIIGGHLKRSYVDIYTYDKPEEQGRVIFRDIGGFREQLGVNKDCPQIQEDKETRSRPRALLVLSDPEIKGSGVLFAHCLSCRLDCQAGERAKKANTGIQSKADFDRAFDNNY